MSSWLGNITKIVNTVKIGSKPIKLTDELTNILYICNIARKTIQHQMNSSLYPTTPLHHCKFHNPYTDKEEYLKIYITKTSMVGRNTPAGYEINKQPEYTLHSIFLGKDLLSATDDEFINTLYHELIHALDPKTQISKYIDKKKPTFDNANVEKSYTNYFSLPEETDAITSSILNDLKTKWHSLKDKCDTLKDCNNFSMLNKSIMDFLQTGNMSNEFKKALLVVDHNMHQHFLDYIVKDGVIRRRFLKRLYHVYEELTNQPSIGNLNNNTEEENKKFAASLNETLGNMGLTQDIINFIQTSPNPTYYIGLLKKNPGLTLLDLQNSVKKTKNPEIPQYTNREIGAASYYTNRPGGEQFIKWALHQIKKMRVGKPELYQAYPDREPEWWFDHERSMIEIENKLGQIYDWYSRVLPNNRFVEITSYDWDHAWRMTEEWHRAAASKGEGKIYEPTNSANIVYGPTWSKPEWEGWTIQLVTSENDLSVEGNLMSHCVGDYCNEVDEGNMAVYSLRDPNNKPHVTIGIQNDAYGEDSPLKLGKIFQVQGVGNSVPKPMYRAMVTEWFSNFQTQHVGLSIGEEYYDWDQLKYCDTRDLEECIEKIATGENESDNQFNYGIRRNLFNIQAVNLYDKVMDKLNNRDSYYYPWMSRIAKQIAELAWESDKRLFNYRYPNTDLKPDPTEIRTFQSKDGEVESLYERMDKNQDNFMDDYDYTDVIGPSPDKEDYETPQEYQIAEAEWLQKEQEARDSYYENYLPGAFDLVIMKRLSELRKKDPFYPNDIIAAQNATNTTTDINADKTASYKHFYK